MVSDHMQTEHGMRVACWSCFLYRVCRLKLGGDGVRWHSGSKGFSGSGGVGGGSSFKRRISAGVSEVVARRQRRGSVMAARVWAKFAQDRALFMGVLHRIIGDKNLNTFLV
jgi:hypothetical protein